MSVLLGLLFIWSILFQGQDMADPCLTGSYKELTDARRSTGYQMLAQEPGLCDINLDPGWYRFTNGKMPEFCPNRAQCGTLVPIWMNGVHPTVADGLAIRKACAYFGTNIAMPCCDHDIMIAVKNCGAFFVYYLQPTQTCPVAYCAGSKTPCPAGQYSKDGFPPCRDAFPVITTSPTFTGPNTSPNTFYFTCRVNYPKRDATQRFEVQWTFDNGIKANIPSVQLKDPVREAVLQGKDLVGNLNHLVRCRVRGWYDDGRSVVQKSQWRQSTESYYVGLRVEPARVEVTDSTTEAKVRVTSTVPIICNHQYTAACCISVVADVDGPKNMVVVGRHCTYKICTRDWNSRTHTATKEITLATSKSQIIKSSNSMLLSFEKINPAGGGPYLNVFSNYNLPQVPVRVKESAPLKCSWTGDPHITGFSGKLIHLYEPGDFTMYKNDKDNFEIQLRTYVCGGGNVACQCGLLIKEQNDIIHISNCGHIGNAPVVETTETTHPLREGTVIERSNDGKTIMVHLPSGREVKVDTGSYYANTYLTIPASDKTGGNGRGICGTPDNRLDNEFTYSNGKVEADPCGQNVWSCLPVQFLESWRHKSQTSLFHVRPPTTQPPTQTAFYCHCDRGLTENKINCSVDTSQHSVRCPGCIPVSADKLLPFLGTQTWAGRKREAVYADMDEPEPPHTPSQRSIGHRWNQTWPTASGITETQARNKCESSIKSSQLYGQSSKDTDLIRDTVTNCILDILFTDSYDTVEASVAAYTDGCQLDLIQDINSYKADDQGNLVLKNEVTYVCSAGCLRHGRCVNGTCVCNHGYTGSSCQLEADEAPRLLRIRGSDKCDVKQQPCRKVFMDAEGFEDSENFMCKVQEILASGSVSTSSALTQSAEFITDARLACALPDAKVKSDRSVKTFAVSFTYDGRTYSNALRVTVFDSTCQDCDDKGCRRKPHTCLINNLCYRDGDVNPNDETETCKTSLSTSQWSQPLNRSTCVSGVALSSGRNPKQFTCSFLGGGELCSYASLCWLMDEGRCVVEWWWSPSDTTEKYSVQINQGDLPRAVGNLTCRVRSYVRTDSGRYELMDDVLKTTTLQA